MGQVSKFVQRRFYSFLNTKFGFAFVFIGFCVIVHALIGLFAFPCVDSVTSINLMGLLRGSDTRVFCAHTNFKDNIGNEDLEWQLAHEPIDIVYTWVNGSDPIWLAKKLKFTARSMKETQSDEQRASDHDNATSSMVTPVVSPNASPIVSRNMFNSSTNPAAFHLGGAANATWNGTIDAAYNNSLHESSEGEKEEEVDEASSDNRYRDSNELRYSLRSLVKYAPWVRNVYIVTDNQIPHWLNMENERLFVVSHSEIFPNASHLPVFSSPAIESHLHRIPGLSKRFIYFNDDVFLGSPVTPEDFVSIGGVQKFTMAWDVPKCAPGCAESWIGDGYCDKACNVEACGFDFPDCLPKNETEKAAVGARGNRASGGAGITLHCSPGCPDSWLSDKVCDTKCKTPECGFDLGDCGVNPLLENYPGTALMSPYFTPTVHAVSVTLSSADLQLVNLTSAAVVNISAPASAMRPLRVVDAGEGESGNATDAANNATLAGATELDPTVAVPVVPSPTMVLPPVVLSVPYGSTYVVHFNISELAFLSGNADALFNSNPAAADADADAFPGAAAAASVASSIASKNLSQIMADKDFVYSSAEYDNENIVHVANILSKHHLLAVILYRTDYPINSGNPHPVTLEPPLSYPEDTTFTVRGFNSATNISVKASFVLRVTAPVRVDNDEWMSMPEKWFRSMPVVPVPAFLNSDLNSSVAAVAPATRPATFTPVFGFLSQCNNFNSLGSSLVAKVRLLQKPFSDIGSDRDSKESDGDHVSSSSGIVLLVEMHTSSDPDADSAHIEALLQTPISEFVVHTEYTLANGTVISVSGRLQNMLGVMNPQGLVVSLATKLEMEEESKKTKTSTLAGSIQTTKDYHASYSNSAFYRETNGTYFAPTSRNEVSMLTSLLLLPSPAAPRMEASEESTGGHSNSNPHNVLLLRLPVPLHPALTPMNSWVHAQWEIILSPSVDMSTAGTNSSVDSDGGGNGDSATEVNAHAKRTEDASSHPGASGCGVISFKWGQYNHTAAEEARRERELFLAAQIAEAQVQHKEEQEEDEEKKQFGPNVTASVTAVTNSSVGIGVEDGGGGGDADETSSGDSRLRRRLLSTEVDTITGGSVAALTRRPFVSSALLEWIEQGRASAKRDRLAAHRIRPTDDANAWSQSPASWMLSLVRSWSSSSTAATGDLNHHKHTYTPFVGSNSYVFQQKEDDKMAEESLAFERERRRKLIRSMEDWMQWLQTEQEQQQEEKGLFGDPDEDTSVAFTAVSAALTHTGGRRRLLAADTYAQSLIHVNRMYNKEFGVENRKVPAHVPHMINREIMDEMQARWPEQWQATSTHRFRSPVDMQYSFAYYHYFMNRHKLKNRNVEKFIRTHVDTNNNGLIDDNEFRTLVAVVKRGQVPVTDTDVDNVRFNCSEERRIVEGGDALKNGTRGDSSSEDNSKETSTDMHTHTTHSNVYGTYKSVVIASPFPSVRELANCSLVHSAISGMDDWNPRPPNHIIGSEKDVAFEMIGDNATETLRLLDSVRARLTKFICINDNIHHPSPALDAVVRQFFLAMYPIPSNFELISPTHQGAGSGPGVSVSLPDERNPTLYTDEYREHYASWRYHLRRQFYQMKYQAALFRGQCALMVRSLALGLLQLVNEPEQDGQAYLEEQRLARGRSAAEPRLVHGQTGGRRLLQIAADVEPGSSITESRTLPFAHILYEALAKLLNKDTKSDRLSLDLTTNKNMIVLALLTAVIGVLACVVGAGLRLLSRSPPRHKMSPLDSPEGAAQQEDFKEYQNHLIDAALEGDGALDSSNKSAYSKRLALAAAREKLAGGGFRDSCSDGTTVSGVTSSSSSIAISKTSSSGGTSVVRRHTYADWNQKSNDFSQREIEQSVQEGLEMARLHRLEMQREAEAEAAAAAGVSRGETSAGSSSSADSLSDIWKKVGSGRRTSATSSMMPLPPLPDTNDGPADPLNDIWKKAGYGLKQAGSSTGTASPTLTPNNTPQPTPKGHFSFNYSSNSSEFLSSRPTAGNETARPRTLSPPPPLPPRPNSSDSVNSLDSMDVPCRVLSQAEVEEHLRRKKQVEEDDEAADLRALGLSNDRSSGISSGIKVVTGVLKAPTPDGANDSHRGLSKGSGPRARTRVSFSLTRNTVDGAPARPVLHALGNMSSYLSAKMHGAKTKA